MGGQGLIWLLVVAVLVVVPFWKLLPRYGINKFFALFAVVPAIALVLLGSVVFAMDRGGRGHRLFAFRRRHRLFPRIPNK